MTRELIAMALAAGVMLGARADTWTDPDTGYTWTYYDDPNYDGVILGGGGYAGGGCGYGCGPDTGSVSTSVSPEPKGAVIIPSSVNGRDVTGLKETFVGFKRMTSVTIPSTVRKIGSYAFYNCSGLKNVTIPNNVNNIGESAFAWCSGLTNLTIPDGVKEIHAYAFESCKGLKSVLLNGNVIIGDFDSSYEDNAFWECSALASVTFLGSHVRITYGAFDYCKKLANVYANKDLKGSLAKSVFGSKCKITYGTAVRLFADSECGTVSGSGVYQPGQKATLKATPAKGYVFAGWYNYWDEEPLSDDGDFRNTSYSYDVTDDNVDIEAWFVTSEEDAESLEILSDEEYETDPDGSFTLNLGELVNSITLPKIAVAGLPTGLKYDAKEMTVSGKATKPGVYMVKVTATNVSAMGEKAVAKTFTLIVPNFSCKALPNLDPAIDTYVFGAGLAFDSLSVDCGAADDGWKVAVSGLPAGLKFDAKTGVITGVATKAGTYTVTFTATKGKEKQIATITLNIAALPDNVVGAFNGFVKTEDGEENLGTFQLTTTDAGKLTAKVVTAAGSYSFGGTCWDKIEGALYSATLVTKKGEKLTLALDSAAGWDKNQLTGSFAAAAGQSPYPIVARKNAFGKTWYFNAEGNERDGWRLSYAENAKVAALTVTLNADGSTKIAGKLGFLNASGKTETISVSASGYADVTSLSEGVIIADFAPVVSVKEGKSTLKRVLSIGTNLWFDRSNDHRYIGSVSLQ